MDQEEQILDTGEIKRLESHADFSAWLIYFQANLQWTFNYYSKSWGNFSLIKSRTFDL